MFSRHAVNTLISGFGFRATPGLLRPAAPHAVNIACRAEQQRQQSHLNAGGPWPAAPPSTIWPPWQIEDLSHWEQHAYGRFGADYPQHCTLDEQSEISVKIHLRRKMTGELKARYGADWYAIMKESRKRQSAGLKAGNRQKPRYWMDQILKERTAKAQSHVIEDGSVL